MRNILLAGAAATAAFTAVPASAAVFTFSYSGVGVTAAGTLTTTDTTTTVNGRQAYTITGITGTRNGALIDQLFPAGTVVDNSGNQTGTNLYASNRHVDYLGFSYGVAGDTPNFLYNVYYYGSTYVEYTSNRAGGGSNTLLPNFTLTQVGGAVPEPATWAMMILGMGTVGFAMRRRQKFSVRFA